MFTLLLPLSGKLIQGKVLPLLDVKPNTLVEIYQCFRGLYCILIQERRASKMRN
jgi:hypothetical protein